MRSKFDEQLADLDRALTQMGAVCEEAIARTTKALLEGDIRIAESVTRLAGEIGHMERDIESMCLRLLLQQQPVARDLRQISAALKMITDLHRIGDQAADIAEIISFMGGRTGAECESIRVMAEAVIRMVTESIDAFVHRDVALANGAIADDDIVDNNFLKTKSALIRMVTSNPADGEYALDLLMIAKYLERIGDHAVNVAGWVVFSVSGSHTGEE